MYKLHQYCDSVSYCSKTAECMLCLKWREQERETEVETHREQGLNESFNVVIRLDGHIKSLAQRDNETMAFPQRLP